MYSNHPFIKEVTGNKKQYKPKNKHITPTYLKENGILNL
jgi:hypothetical protein